MEFEIIKVEKNKQRLLVEIEISETRERKHYGYPLGEGWENKINDEFKFLRDIKKKLGDEEEIENTPIDFDEINDSVKGKKIKVEKK